MSAPEFYIRNAETYFWTGDVWDEHYYAKVYDDMTEPLPPGGQWWKMERVEPVSNGSDTTSLGVGPMRLVTVVPYRGYVIVVQIEDRALTVTLWHTGLEVDRIESGWAEVAPALIEAKRIIDGWMNAP